MRWLLVIGFGDTAPGRKCRDLLFVALPWLIADVFTKCLALKFLEKRELSLLSGELKLFLSVNETLFSRGHTPSKLGSTSAIVFWGAMSVGLSAVACFPFVRAQWSVPRKILFLLAVLLGGVVGGFLVGRWLEWEPDRLVLHAMRAFSATAFLLLGLRLTRSRYLGIALATALAGTLGNAINIAYYPRGIIDFIYVPILSPYLGVFNLSDAALEVAKGLILLSPLTLVLLRRMAKDPIWQRRLVYVNPVEAPVSAMTSNSNLFTRLLSVWGKRGAKIRNAVSEGERKAFETKHNVTLPNDLRDYLNRANGLDFNDNTELMFSFWQLDRWVPASVRLVSPADQRNYTQVDPDRYFCFADYMIEAELFMIRLSADVSEPNDVRGWNGIKKADSFSQFIEKYLENPNTLLAPPPQ